MVASRIIASYVYVNVGVLPFASVGYAICVKIESYYKLPITAHIREGAVLNGICRRGRVWISKMGRIRWVWCDKRFRKIGRGIVATCHQTQKCFGIWSVRVDVE